MADLEGGSPGAGFVLRGFDESAAPAAVAAAAPSRRPLRFAMLGDSIAFGQGAAKPADTPGERLKAALIEADTPTELRVFAVPGAKSDALAAQVRAAVGWKAQLAVIIIGANDLTRFVPPAVAAGQLRSAVEALRKADCEVVVAPAPDLSVVPWVPAQFRSVVSAGSGLLREAQTRAAVEAGATVADVHETVSPRFSADPTLFSADRFHPGSEGYTLIAQALTLAVRSVSLRARPLQ